MKMIMKNIQKLISMTAAVAVLSGIFAVPAMASTRSVITSVSIRISLDTENGADLPDDPESCVTANSSKYSVTGAEWVTDIRDVTIGDTPRMKVYLTPEYSNEREYYFRGGYSSSNVKISGGTFVSSKREGDDLVVTLKTKPIQGQYDPPTDAYWREYGYGNARWEAPDDGSGYYDVNLYRGSSVVKKLEAYKGTSYNFYPYMTKAGTYSFKVRTVPSSSSSLKASAKSDWTESDEIYISKEEVSDGSGQTSDDGQGVGGGTTKVGWILDGGTWYYRYPDGSYMKNGWCKINNKWYLFNSSGQMLTGWQNVNNQWFFLNSDGDMLTGWLKSGNVWYYLNTTAGSQEGVMCTNVWIQIGDKTYYVNQSGVMVEGWKEVAGSWYYFYPGQGHKAVNTTIDGFYVDANGVWHK